MSHTNSTTNYNLPQFIGTDKPTWLNDVNGAFSAIDTQMKANADSATSASTSATTANNAIGTLASLQTTAKTDLVTAINEVNTNAGVAQNTANGASTTANATATALNGFEQKFNLTDITTHSPSTQGNVNTGEYTLAQNADGSIFKFYGSKRYMSSSVLLRSAISGLSGYYGCPTGLFLNTHPSEGYIIKGAGMIVQNKNDESAINAFWEDYFAVGTDGQIYIWVSDESGNKTVPNGVYRQIQYPPCLYFNANFGDTPTPDN